MAVWVVRAGRHGEQQEVALSKGVVCHGWNSLPDYSSCPTKAEFRVIYLMAYPDQPEKKVIAGLSQTWRFAREIQKHDIVALPLKTEATVAFGRITGDYEYRPLASNVMHT